MIQFTTAPTVAFNAPYDSDASLAAIEKEAKSLGFDITTFRNTVTSWDLTLKRARRYGFYTADNDRFGQATARWGSYEELPRVALDDLRHAIVLSTDSQNSEAADRRAAAEGYDISEYADSGHTEATADFTSYKSSVAHDPQPGETVVFRVMPAYAGVTVCPLTVTGNTTNSTKPHHYEVVVLTGSTNLAGASFSIHNSLSESAKVNVSGLNASTETPLGSSGLHFKMAEGYYLTGSKYIIKLEATAGNTSAALCAKVMSTLSQVSTIRNNQPNISFGLALSERPKLESKAAGAGLPIPLIYAYDELVDLYGAGAINGLSTNQTTKLGRCYFEVNGVKNYLKGGLGFEKAYNLTAPGGAVVKDFTTDVTFESGNDGDTNNCFLHGFSSPDTYGVGKFVINHADGGSHRPCETTGNFSLGNGLTATSPAFIYFKCDALPSPNPAGYKGTASVKLLAVPY